MLIDYSKSKRDSVLTHFVGGLVNAEKIARSRTAERLWTMRAQLRESDAQLDACITPGFYLTDIRKRREAVQRVRAEPLQSKEPQGSRSQTSKRNP